MVYSNWDKIVGGGIVSILVSILISYWKHRERKKKNKKPQVISLLNQFLMPFMRALKDEKDNLGAEGELGSGVVVMDEPYYKLQEEFEGRVEKDEAVKLLFEQFISNRLFHRDRERIVELIGEHDKRIEDVEKSLNEFADKFTPYFGEAIQKFERDANDLMAGVKIISKDSNRTLIRDIGSVSRSVLDGFLAAKTGGYPEFVKEKLEKDEKLEKSYKTTKEKIDTLKEIAKDFYDILKKHHDAFINDYKIYPEELEAATLTKKMANTHYNGKIMTASIGEES